MANTPHVSKTVFRPDVESDSAPTDLSANVINMPSGAPFLTLLASALRAELGANLADALILLPTRRAVRELGQAFIDTAGQDGALAALLPTMRPLADVDPDEPPFEPGDLAHMITPSIDPMRRRFALSTLVLQKEARLRGVAPDAAGALALTEPLLTLLDDSFMDGLQASDMEKLDPVIEMSAKHYGQAAVFFKIISQYWPQYLADNDLMDPMQRRVALLNALSDLWQESPPQTPVIIAGSTGTLAATAKLMSVVSRLPMGAIILPGLDTHLDEVVWNEVGVEHPQGALKQLLASAGVARSQVRLFPDYERTLAQDSRRRLIAQSLIPADQTAGWLDRIAAMKSSVEKGDPFGAGLSGLSLIEAGTGDEEASAIALILREALETPGKNAALVTPDPLLGRRVAAKLTRFNVNVDVSAGQPLEETAAGAYLSLILTLAADPWDPVALAGLFKHPLFAMGQKEGAARKLWLQIESAGFHGPRPLSLEDLAARRDVTTGDFAPALKMIGALHNELAPLSAHDDVDASVSDVTRLHAEIAETLAATPELTGAQRLWCGEDGDAAQSLISDLLREGHLLGNLKLPAYVRLLGQLMRGRVVRPKFGTEPRLQILGPLEARMISADTLVLGGLNEGVWPAAPAVDPILSYAMRQEIGLTSPERRYGLAAHDFAQLAAHEQVILTRAKKTDDGPAVASRWIWRLKTLLRGALGDVEATLALAPSTDYLALARALDSVDASDVRPASRPEPAPPLHRRWPNDYRQLPVTQIETLTRDPYSIFARKVLGLRKLDPLDAPIGPREYGTAVHKALEDFTLEFKSNLPSHASGKAQAWLTARLKRALREAGYPDTALAREAPRMARMAQWFTGWERSRREQGWTPRAVEIKGKWELNAPGCKPFYLTAEADRIDTGPEGFAVLDYKTGAAPSGQQVALGFNSQLPLEGAMLESGAFGLDLPAGELAQLLYVKVSGDRNLGSDSIAGGAKADPRALSEEAYEGLLELLAAFDDPLTPYTSQPRAETKNQNSYGDFDHLARRAEWASVGDEPSGGSNE